MKLDGNGFYFQLLQVIPIHIESDNAGEQAFFLEAQPFTDKIVDP
jgi:hypothetical protein